MLNALTGNDPLKVLQRRSAVIANIQIFNVKIGLEGSPVTAQKKSGRCWIFSATNVFRVAIMKKYNLKDFELSQAYLSFWDKIEKSNFFLEEILKTAAEPLDDRLVQNLLKRPLSDGGYWERAINLVEKYGLVPQTAYPDAFSASDSQTVLNLISTKLREYALELRHLAQDDRTAIAAAKERMMREVHFMLVLMLGAPPPASKNLTWEFYDRDDKFKRLSIKPLDLAKDLAQESNSDWTGGLNIFNLFTIGNDPRHEYGRLIGTSRLDNKMVDGRRRVRFVNVDMDTMKKACITMLKADIPIGFYCDSDNFKNRETGIFDNDLIDYETPFDISFGLNKAQRLMTQDSSSNHGMVLTGVHLDEHDKPVRWRVQNSWGDEVGKKGWFVMSDRWMDEYVYLAVVDPKYARLICYSQYTALANNGTTASCRKRSARSSTRNRRCKSICTVC